MAGQRLGTLLPVMPDLNARVVRRALRALAPTAVVLLTLVPAPALAAPPSTWPEPEPVSALDYLLVLLVIPLGLALLITVLAYVPVMVKGERYTPGRAWRNENEWFGGPSGGLEASDKAEVPADADRGGASARW